MPTQHPHQRAQQIHQTAALVAEHKPSHQADLAKRIAKQSAPSNPHCSSPDRWVRGATHNIGP